MPTPAVVDTRTRLVDAALELFWFRGYEATSLAQVCRHANANPGSLYYYFPSKEALLTAALDRLLETIDENLLEPAWQGVDDPIDRIFALLDAYRRALTSTDFTYGCPIGSLALEWRDPPDAVREGLAANFEGWTRAVRGCLEQARDRFPDGTDLDALAVFVLTTMEGGVMLARTRRDILPFDQGVCCLRRLIRALEAEREDD